MRYVDRLVAADWIEPALATARAIARSPDDDSDDRLRAAGIIGRTGQAAEGSELIRELLIGAATPTVGVARALDGWTTSADVVSMIGDPSVSAEVRIDLAEGLVDTDMEEAAAGVLASLATDTASADKVRVKAAIALAEFSDKNRSQQLLESLAVDTNVDASARCKAATAAWREETPAEAAPTLLNILHDPTAQDFGCRPIGDMLCRLGRQRDLLAVVKNSTMDYRCRVLIAESLGTCGKSEQALSFLWGVVRDGGTSRDFRKSALAALRRLGSEQELIDWAEDESAPRAAKLAVAEAFLRSKWRREAQALLRDVLHDPQGLTDFEKSEAGRSLADAGEAALAAQLALDPLTDQAVAGGAILALSQLEMVRDLRRTASSETVPKGTRLHAIRALAYLKRQAEAVREVQNMTAGFASSASGLIERARAYEAIGLLDEAASDFGAVARDPEQSAELRCLGAMGLSRANHVEDAERVLVGIVSDPTTPAPVAAAAVKTLGELGSHRMDTPKGAVALILKCLRNSDQPLMVREAAAHALGTDYAAELLRQTEGLTEVHQMATDVKTPSAVRIALTDPLVELDEGVKATSLLASIASDPAEEARNRLAAVTKLWILRDPSRQGREAVRKAASAHLRAVLTDSTVSAMVATLAVSSAPRR